MKLYYTPGACSLAVHIVLREAGFDPELIKVDLRSHCLATGENFYEINPKGYVPALVLDDGRMLTEIAAIVQYLADLKPEARLAPAAGSFERVELQAWLNYIATEVHKSFGPLFRAEQAGSWAEVARQNLARRLELLATLLEKQPFILGEQYSVADSYLFTTLGWSGYVKFDLEPWPALLAFRERVAARPAVQAALKAEGLI